MTFFVYTFLIDHTFETSFVIFLEFNELYYWIKYFNIWLVDFIQFEMVHRHLYDNQWMIFSKFSNLIRMFCLWNEYECSSCRSKNCNDQEQVFIERFSKLLKKLAFFCPFRKYMILMFLLIGFKAILCHYTRLYSLWICYL